MPKLITLTLSDTLNSDDIIPILPTQVNADLKSKTYLYRDKLSYFPPIACGSHLLDQDTKQECFQVVNNCTLPCALDHEANCSYVKVLTNLNPFQAKTFEIIKRDYTLAIVTLSDLGAQGKREDTSGQTIANLLTSTLPISYVSRFILPDEHYELRLRLEHLALIDQYDIICTTGGTGLTARDITAQTTKQILDYEIWGFSFCMMQASLAKTPNACLSRSVVGVLQQSLIINLPGSRKAVDENLSAILPALPHALAKLHNDNSACGG